MSGGKEKEGEREGRSERRGGRRERGKGEGERKERGWMYKALRMTKLSIVYRVSSTWQSLLFVLCVHL